MQLPAEASMIHSSLQLGLGGRPHQLGVGSVIVGGQEARAQVDHASLALQR